MTLQPSYRLEPATTEQLFSQAVPKAPNHILGFVGFNTQLLIIIKRFKCCVCDCGGYSCDVRLQLADSMYRLSKLPGECFH